jgi:hypothetical protein
MNPEAPGKSVLGAGMISVSDILKILDQVPIWKALREMPKRMEALEQRIQQLERGAMTPPKKPMKGRECSSCGKEMALVSERKDPALGPVGIKLHKLKCPACGFESDRQFSPGDGYL